MGTRVLPTQFRQSKSMRWGKPGNFCQQAPEVLASPAFTVEAWRMGSQNTKPGPCWDRFSSTATSCSTSVRMISTMTAEAHCSCPPTFQEGRSRSSQLQMGIMLRAGRARVFKGSCHLLDCLSCYRSFRRLCIDISWRRPADCRLLALTSVTSVG